MIDPSLVVSVIGTLLSYYSVAQNSEDRSELLVYIKEGQSYLDNLKLVHNEFQKIHSREVGRFIKGLHSCTDDKEMMKELSEEFVAECERVYNEVNLPYVSEFFKNIYKDAEAVSETERMSLIEDMSRKFGLNARTLDQFSRNLPIALEGVETYLNLIKEYRDDIGRRGGLDEPLEGNIRNTVRKTLDAADICIMAMISIMTPLVNRL